MCVKNSKHTRSDNEVYSLQCIYCSSTVQKHQTVKQAKWKCWKGYVQRLGKKDSKRLPATHESCITIMQLLTQQPAQLSVNLRVFSRKISLGSYIYPIHQIWTYVCFYPKDKENTEMGSFVLLDCSSVGDSTIPVLNLF